MPKATADRDTVRKELKTLPEGFVALRKLAYGEILERREIMSTMGAASAPANRAQRRGNEPVSSDNGEVRVKVHYTAIQQFDFGRCIVEHNLEDENGNLLQLATLDGIRKLDPKIGQEIEALIDDLNNLDLEKDESKSPEVASVGEGPSKRDTAESGSK